MKRLVWFILTVFLLGGVNGSLSAASEAPSTRVAASNSPWIWAVVFKRVGDRRTYAGMVFRPMVPFHELHVKIHERPAPADQRIVSGKVDHEIWLTGNGVTLGLWYSHTEGKFGEIGSDGEFLDPHGDADAMDRIVTRARQIPAPKLPPRFDSIASASYLPGPPDLASLCKSAEFIAVGVRAGVLRTAHTPIGTTNAEQHTVSLFAVEELLKSPKDNRPAVLKVRQPYGNLPFVMFNGRVTGVGSVVKEDPPLLQGERYVLFLNSVPDPDGSRRAWGYLQGTHYGVTGKTGELDELHFTDVLHGRVLLHSGRAVAQPQVGEAENDWKFVREPQIVDVSEEQAISAIRAALKSETSVK